MGRSGYLLLQALLLLLGAAAAHSESFPARPIKIVIPFAAGGSAEPLARLLAEVVQRDTGASIVIEARPGAGGNIGAGEVAKADKDGYTLLLGANNNFTVNQFLFSKATLEPERDFSLITILADQHHVLYVRKDFQPQTFREFLEYVRARPGQVNYGSPGVGSAPHLSAELLSDLFGLQMVHVPYRGGALAITGLLTGEIQLYPAALSTGKGQIDSGHLRALAVTAPARMRALPNVPTTAETGAPEYATNNWWGLAAPKGTPEANIQWIHQAFTRALRDPAIKTKLEDLGFILVGTTSAEFVARVRHESALYKQLIQKRNLAIQ